MCCKRLTAIAWLIIIASGLASIISLFVFANWLVGGYGSQSGSFFEWVSIVPGPPVTFVAAIGLLRRWRWARFDVLRRIPWSRLRVCRRRDRPCHSATPASTMTHRSIT